MRRQVHVRRDPLAAAYAFAVMPEGRRPGAATMRQRVGRWSALPLALTLVACTGTPPTASPTMPASTPAVTAQPTAAPTPPDLAARPLIWFAPLPPMPTDAGRPFIGSEDFMALFEPGAAWATAAERTHVFKLYGEWVAYHATDAELRTAVQEIARRGMALAVEMGPLDPPPECGHGVESFAGIDEGQLISRRIRRAGGRLQVIALDEPYYFAHVYAGERACGWPLEQVAEAVAGFTAAMREEWPELLVGDTEPMPVPVTSDGLAAWLDAYAAAAGEPFAFLHLDMDWARPDWPALGVAVETHGAARGVPVGIIYNGGAATSDTQWLSVTGRRVTTYETEAGAQPDHVLFQSWMDKPDQALPETDDAAFTSLINRYLDDPASLADLPTDGDNLAFGRPATASSSIGDATPDRAIDGDGDTVWNAGAGPVAWIEIDLGAPTEVHEIRLTVSQDPAGLTDHVLSCRDEPGGSLKGFAATAGTTADLAVLTIELTVPRICRLLRIETRVSPSWVAWREIEVR